MASPHVKDRRMRRIAAAASLAAVVSAGLVVHGALPDSPAADIAGDALYAVAAFSGLVLLFPRARTVAVAALAVGFCVAVEVMQLTGLPQAIGAAFPPAILVLGSGFDGRDLVVYAAAAVTAGALDAAARRRIGMPPAAGGLDRA